MKPRNTEHHRRVLEAKRAELTASEHQGRAVAVAAEPVPDLTDEWVFANDRDLALAMLDKNTMLLRQVMRALDRIATGTYGVCQECEEPISERRLGALPWAALCLKCQEEEDNRRGPSPVSSSIGSSMGLSDAA
jgi:DnaK suppressor protein